MMEADIRVEVLERLQNDYDLRVKQTGALYMRGGTCPSCRQKELYARHDNPWQIRCGRPKCGLIEDVKDIYPDIFEDWSKRAPATEDNPTATARAYLEYVRGFDVGMIGAWFTQENYVSSETGDTSATVRFEMPNGGYWERLIDRASRFGKMKARFKYKYSIAGQWWCPPDTDLHTVDELWIVEGVFDAIALVMNGIKAVSAMSCNNYPGEALKALAELRKGDLPTLVWALDNDPAAHGYLMRWVKLARELGFTCRAALVPQRGKKKVDWNDLHLRWNFEDKGEARDKRRERDLAAARHEGKLLLAPSPREKALLMYTWDESSSEFALEFGHQTYWAKFDLAKLDKKEEGDAEPEDHDEQLTSDREARRKALEKVCTIKLLVNCRLQPLYKQVNEVTEETWFYVNVATAINEKGERLTFTPKQLSSSGEFKTRITNASVTWLGTQKHLDQIMMRQIENLSTVGTIDFLGYSKEHKAYIFNNVAIKDGSVFKANEDDYFELGKQSVKCLMRSVKMDVAIDDRKYSEAWLDKLWLVFRENGLLGLTYWFGSLYAEQIRAEYESFPFLEMSGEPDSGKTTLIKFLWKLFGRLYEGFDPAKGSASGRSRAMGQVANLPLVLLEADRNTDADNAKSFEWDEFKDYYGGGLLRTRGVKNNSNDTYEPPFRASIVIAQNAIVAGHEAILSRIVRLPFLKPTITEESRAAADALVQTELENVNYFIVKAMKAEPQVMAKFAEVYPKYRAQLWASKKLSSDRVIRNHAQIMALLDCLQLVLPIPGHMVQECHKYIEKMASERQGSITTDPKEVVEFWQVYEYLENLSGEPLVNHSKKTGQIAINLNQFAEVAHEHRQKIPDLATLRRLLKDGRTHPMIDASRRVESQIRALQKIRTPLESIPPTVRCFVFKE